MRVSNSWAIVLAVAAVSSCTATPAPSTQPTPAPGQGPAASPTAAAPSGGGANAAPGNANAAPGGAPRRRPPPNPAAQDTARRAIVDSILKQIAGREQLPAGQVFKNVTFLKDMPAGEFLKTMDTNYGRALGWTCNNCHVIGQFDVDTRKNKRIARQMQLLTALINNDQLPKVKELDEKYEPVTCVTCHHGANEPKSTMGILLPPTAAPPGPGTR